MAALTLYYWLKREISGGSCGVRGHVPGGECGYSRVWASGCVVGGGVCEGVGVQ